MSALHTPLTDLSSSPLSTSANETARHLEENPSRVIIHLPDVNKCQDQGQLVTISSWASTTTSSIAHLPHGSTHHAVRAANTPMTPSPPMSATPYFAPNGASSSISPSSSSCFTTSTLLSTSSAVMTTIGIPNDTSPQHCSSPTNGNHAPPSPLYNLPTELVQHIASFLPFDELLRFYKSLPRPYRPLLEPLVDQAIALMALQLEIHQERSVVGESLNAGAGVGGMANRMLNRLMSLVVMEPSTLLSFVTDAEDDPPPLVPMANPDPGQPQPIHDGGARPTPVTNDATLTTSWRAVEFDKESLRITFELEEKLELERTLRQQQLSVFAMKEEESDDREASHNGPAGTSERREQPADQKDPSDKANESKEVIKKKSMSETQRPAVLRSPAETAAPALTSTVPGIFPSPFPGLCQSLLDSHLRQSSYFHCISTTQPAFLQSAKVQFRGSRSMAAPWISLPSTDPKSLWSRPRSHWSLADVEAALAQQFHHENCLTAGRPCLCRFDKFSSPLSTTQRLSKRTQERIAIFHQNRVLARFLTNSHSLASRRHPRDNSLLFSSKEYLSTKVPLEVAELCTSKTVQAAIVTTDPSSVNQEASSVHGDSSNSHTLEFHALGEVVGVGSRQVDGPRRRKRDVLREGWRQLFGSPTEAINDSEGSLAPASCPAVSSFLGADSNHESSSSTSPKATRIVMRTIRNTSADFGCTIASSVTTSQSNVTNGLSTTTRDPSIPMTGDHEFLSSTSIVSSVAKRLVESASFLSSLAPPSTTFPHCILSDAFQGPANAMTHPYAVNGTDDGIDASDDDDNSDIALGRWDEGDTSRRKDKEWLREKQGLYHHGATEGDQEQQQRPRLVDEEKPLFELTYGVGHNYMNAARLEGERVVRPIRFSCSIDFFLLV